MAEETFENGELYDVTSLLVTEERDFLIRNNGDQVKVKDLSGKIVALYFSAVWCPPCRRFTPSLIEVYNQLSSKGDFEVVFVSSDRDEESFQDYFSKMPWLAIPLADKDLDEILSEKFGVMGIPHVVILGKDGKILTNEGVQVIMEYEAEAYPFTPERIIKLIEEEEEAKNSQNLQTLLVSGSRDYLISSDEKKVPVTELEGSMVGLYFCVGSYGDCIAFTKKLAELYKELKKKGEKFEIVLIYLEEDDEGFREILAQIPCVSLPLKDKKISKLSRYFDLSSIPRLVIIGPNGKTLNEDVVELIDEHGAMAYPFTPEKLAELAEIEKAKLESQTLESVLVSGEKDYVIDKSGSKVRVFDLVGKHVLIYFSAHWCPPCRAFTPKLIEVYHEIKAKESAFEIIFASSDRDQSSFDEYYADMPWLALPFGDERKAELSRKFKVKGIPCLVAIGPEGKTVTKEAREIIGKHGADAFPFTEDHIKNLEGKMEEMAKGWPEKIKHELHEHELVKVRRDDYYCDECDSAGHSWSFYCKDCDFDLDPKCALKNMEKPKQYEDTAETKEVYICEGAVCHNS